MIELIGVPIAAKMLRNGVDNINISSPAKLKIHTTGDGGGILINAGPAHGKQWSATVRVEIIETDA